MLVVNGPDKWGAEVVRASKWMNGGGKKSQVLTDVVLVPVTWFAYMCLSLMARVLLTLSITLPNASETKQVWKPSAERIWYLTILYC